MANTSHVTWVRLSGGWQIKQTEYLAARIMIEQGLGYFVYRIRDERETDREAIARGYGPQILALMFHGQARGYSWSREEGMTVAEVHRTAAKTRKPKC